MIQRENDGVRWELQPDFAPLLESLLHSPGQTVKQSPVKRVTRHEVAGKTFYIKRYLHHAVALRPLKYFFKPTQAREEWQLAGELEARQIPIVRHVALGERHSWRGIEESILVTEGFDGAQLDETTGIDGELVKSFVEQMHAAGVIQFDLHPANLLVGRKTGEIRLVDLHGTVVRAVLTSEERVENLAVLRGYLPFQASDEIVQAGIRSRRERIRSRARRCFRRNRDFSRDRLDGLQWQYRPALLDAAGRQILAAPDEFLQSLSRALKQGRSSTVGASGSYVLKRYNFRRFTRLAKDLFRRSPACNSFLKAYHLELLGIPTARPVAAAEKRLLCFLQRSYFLMEEIPGALSLEAHLRNGPRLEAPVIEAVGILIGRLHREGFSHRDLKCSNLILNAAGQPHLIDLDGLSFLNDVPHERALSDLARLARSVSEFQPIENRERRKFLMAYSRERRRIT